MENLDYFIVSALVSYFFLKMELVKVKEGIARVAIETHEKNTLGE